MGGLMEVDGGGGSPGWASEGKIDCRKRGFVDLLLA